jgi:hypothetical protein
VGYEPNAPYERPPLSKELWWTDDPDVGTKLEFTNYKGEKTTFAPSPLKDIERNVMRFSFIVT